MKTMRRPSLAALPAATGGRDGTTTTVYQNRAPLCVFCEARLYRGERSGRVAAAAAAAARSTGQQRRYLGSTSRLQVLGQQQQQQQQQQQRRQQHSGTSPSASSPLPSQAQPPTAGKASGNSQAQADAVRKALLALSANSLRDREMRKREGNAGQSGSAAETASSSSISSSAAGTEATTASSKTGSSGSTLYGLGSFLDGLAQKRSRGTDGSSSQGGFGRQRQKQQLQPQERLVRRAPPQVMPELESKPEPEPKLDSRPARAPVQAPYDSELAGGWQHLRRDFEQQRRQQWQQSSLQAQAQTQTQTMTQAQEAVQQAQQQHGSAQTDSPKKSQWELLKESQNASSITGPPKKSQWELLKESQNASSSMGSQKNPQSGVSRKGSQKMSPWDLLRESQNVSEQVRKKRMGQEASEINQAEYLHEREKREEETRNGNFVGLSKKSARRCFYCGEEGHAKIDCPTRLADDSSMRRQTNFNYTTATAMHAAAMEQTSEGSEFFRGRRRNWQKKSLPEDRFDLDYQPDEKQDTAAEEKKRKKEEKRREREARKREIVAGPTPIFLPDFISVSNLASALKVRVEAFIEKMEELGFETVSYDHVLNAENAGLIAMEYGFEPATESNKMSEGNDLQAQPWPADKSALPSRPPVVTIMGHVDHGKTTILDYLRKTSVAASEHGGITQHIGAFSVPLASGKTITFLDTPGHAAFLSMRERGANVTDIVILVVAADDGVKPQTVEAIKHAKSAQVPVIVAINKIDKDEAAPDRVKSELARHGIDIEDFGGETQTALISGKTGAGVDQLEEAIITLSEILDHRAPQDGPVEGWVLEATTSKAGRAATLLIRRGTLRQGDIIVAGTKWARVRVMRNEAGVEISEAGPGFPVEVHGWRGQPIAGDEVLQAPSEQRATTAIRTREGVESRQRLAEDTQAINETRKLDQEQRERDKASAAEKLAIKAAEAEKLGRTLHWRSLKHRSLTNISTEYSTAEASSGTKFLNLVINADVSGSVEAVVNAISSLGNNEVQPRIIRTSVGAISESDVDLASAAAGHVITFNVPVDTNITQLAEARKVNILEQNIIYRLVDDVKSRLADMLPPAVVQRVTGEAEVLQVFGIDVKKRKGKLMIAGCKIRNGLVTKGSKARVMRGRKNVFEGVYTLVLSRFMFSCRLNGFFFICST